MSVKNLSEESVYFKGKEKEFVQYATGDYLVLRLDGRGFSKFTKDINKPFDKLFMDIMEETAMILSENTSNVVMYYTQSDEISLLLTKGFKEGTQMLWGGKVSKLISDTVATATAVFNTLLQQKYIPLGFNKENYMKTGNIFDLARFDSRVLSFDTKEDVLEYFKWRQADCIKNSISMLSDSLYSHKELDGKSTNERKILCVEKGQDWDKLPSTTKYGRVGYRQFNSVFLPTGKYKTEWVTPKETPLFNDKDGEDLINQFLYKGLSEKNILPQEYKYYLVLDNTGNNLLVLSNTEDFNTLQGLNVETNKLVTVKEEDIVLFAKFTDAKKEVMIEIMKDSKDNMEIYKKLTENALEKENK